MTKLFRKGRFNFFKGKGIGQYILYIVLEMVLVVAGILIALEINNANEDRKKEAKANFILEEVRRDLQGNLEVMRNFRINLEAKDSLLVRVLQDSVKREDYQTNFNYTALIMTYASITFLDNGFENMTRQSEYFNRDYDTLFTDLEDLYEEQYHLVETMQERLSDLVIYTIENWSREKAWFHLLSRGQLTEEALDYFTEDPFYRNAVDLYRTYAVINILPAIRAAEMQTTLAIIEINQKLNAEADAYADFDGYLIPTDPKLWAQDTGTYDLFGQVQFKLALEGEILSMGQIGDPMYRVYPRNDSTLYLPQADLKILCDHNGESIRLKGKRSTQLLKRIKP